jgi:peptidyl-prolyl cis-trans isomerase B (cyclophilin B)
MLARQRYERRAQRRAQRDQRTRKWTVSILAAVAVVAVTVGSVFLFGGIGKKTAAAASATPSATPTATPSATPTAPVRHCTYTANPPAARKVSFPPTTPDYQATYRATIKTNRGAIVIDLLNSKATCTVNSFVHLAEQAYFNKTHCHRLTTASPYYVLQCGDPTGTGKGGPGYEFASENLAGAKYTAGTVAMANTGQADSNGSQFFLVYKNSSLPANYTPFGTIVRGLNIIQKVAKAGSDNSNGQGDGHPKEKVEIERVTIKKT